MDGALPAMGAGGISNTSTRRPPPPVSGGPKLFVKGFETIVSVPSRSETKYFGKCQNLNFKKMFQQWNDSLLVTGNKKRVTTLKKVSGVLEHECFDSSERHRNLIELNNMLPGCRAGLGAGACNKKIFLLFLAINLTL